MKVLSADVTFKGDESAARPLKKEKKRKPQNKQGMKRKGLEQLNAR
jgi:hypothetical protein